LEPPRGIRPKISARSPSRATVKMTMGRVHRGDRATMLGTDMPISFLGLVQKRPEPP
jgi:hypothetical protein